MFFIFYNYDVPFSKQSIFLFLITDLKHFLNIDSSGFTFWIQYSRQFLLPEEALNSISKTQDLSCLWKGTISIVASFKKKVFKGTSPWSASSLLWQFKVRKKNEIIERKMFKVNLKGFWQDFNCQLSGIGSSANIFYGCRCWYLLKFALIFLFAYAHWDTRYLRDKDATKIYF